MATVPREANHGFAWHCEVAAKGSKLPSSMNEPVTYVNLVRVNVARERGRGREWALLESLRAARGFDSVEIAERDSTQTWFRVAIPTREHILEVAIDVLLATEGFAVEVQGAMYGSTLVVVFNAVPGSTARPRRLRRHLDGVAAAGSVSALVGSGWVRSIPAPPIGQPDEEAVDRRVATPAPAAEPIAIRIGPATIALHQTQPPHQSSILPTSGSAVTGQASRPWWRRLPRRFHQKRTFLVCLGLLPLAAWFLAPPTLRFAAIPGGVDQWGHLLRLSVLREAVAGELTIPLWLPEWYVGQDFLQYYPPLAYFFLLPAVLVTGDPGAGYTAMAFAILGFTAIGMYWATRRAFGNTTAFAAAMAYTLVPLNLAPMFGEGNLPWALATAVIPWFFGLLLRVIEKPSRRAFVLLAFSVAALVLAHSMLAFMTVVGVAVLVTAYTLLSRRPFDTPVVVGLSVLAGAGLAAVWLLPGTTHLDLASVPFMQPEKVALWSSNSTMFDRGLATESLRIPGSLPPRYLGFGFPLLALGGLIASLTRPESRLLSIALGAMAVATFVLSYGINLPGYHLLPLSDNLLPNRFLSVTVLPLSVLVGLLARRAIAIRPALHLNWGASTLRLGLGRIVLVLLVLLLWAEYSPFLSWKPVVSFAGVDQPLGYLGAADGGRSENGRYWDTTPINDSRQAYTVPEQADRLFAQGWAVEGSIHHDSFALMGQSLVAGYPEALVRTAYLWNVEYVQVLDSDTALSQAFAGGRFQPVETYPFKTLYRFTGEPSYLFEQDRDTLAIGYDAQMVADLFPWVTSGRSPHLSDYHGRYLDEFDVLVLAKPEPGGRPGTLRSWIEERLRSGQRVVVDLATPAVRTAVGITSDVYETAGPAPLFRDGRELGAASLPPLIYAPRSPDGVLVQAGVDATLAPLVSYKDMPQGRVFLLGSLLLATARSNHDEVLARALEPVIGSSLSRERLRPKPLAVTSFERSTNRLDAQFTIDESGMVILSESYSPHWEARLNGQQIELYDHEHIIAFTANAGGNQLNMRYRPSASQYLGLGLTALSLAGLAIAAWRLPLIVSVSGRLQIRDLGGGLARALDWLFGGSDPPAPQTGG